MSLWNSRLTRKAPLRSKARSGRRTKSDFKKSPLKKVSKSQRDRLKKYYPIQAQFLIENPVCAICLLLDEPKPSKATEVHHARSRNGKLLFDTSFFVPSCRNHREWPHEHPAQARELGVLASVGEWGISPSFPAK